MPFTTYLSATAAEIETTLKDVLEQWKDRVARTEPQLTPLVAEFSKQCDGGKRIRGTLVCLGYELAGGEKTPEILKPAVAFEIFQTAILSHDDVIDKSPLRRGRPSLYHALGADHYGISQTISLGDLGFFLATELIAESNFPADNVRKAIRSFSEIMQKTALGEMLDVLMPTKDSVTDADIISIATLKTAPYSVIGPLSLGALLAGADNELLQKMADFGKHLGIAYQIHDDMLGVFSESEKLGKPNTADIAEGKATLLFWHAKNHAEEKQKAVLEELYGRAGVTPDAVEQIKTVFKETGAYDYALKMKDDHTEKAQALIPQLTTDKELQEHLRDLTNFFVNRTN